MKKVLLILGFVFGVVGLASAPTYAHDREDWSRDRWRSRGAVLGIKDWNITEKNCSKVQSRIASKLESLKKAGEQREAKYQRISDRVQKVIELAKAQEIDTAKLEADLLVFSAKVTVYKEEVKKLYDLLETTKEVDCEGDQGPDELRVILQEAREQLKVVRTASKEIHTFLKDTLRPDLTKVKEALEALEDQQEQESTESTN